MQKNDLKQISNLLDEKFEENNKNFVTKDDLKENNKEIFKKIDGVKELLKKKFNWLGESTKKGFDEVDKKLNGIDVRLDGIDLELKKKADKSTLLVFAYQGMEKLAVCT